MAATMDHSDIRGLGTALHLFLAGLPRSRNGDHPKGCSLKSVEDSHHRSRIALHSSAGTGLIVPINRGAARSASAIAIAMDSLNIQSNVGSGRLFHGLSPDGFGSTIPSGTLHVARRTHLRNPRYRRQTTSKTFNMRPTPMRTCGHDV